MPIAVTVATTILILSIRDAMVAMSQARPDIRQLDFFRMLGEKDRRTIRLKTIFCRHVVDAASWSEHPSIPCQRGLKATIAATISEKS